MEMVHFTKVAWKYKISSEHRPRNVFEQGGATIARGGHQHFTNILGPTLSIAKAMHGIRGHARNAISHVSQHRTAQNKMHKKGTSVVGGNATETACLYQY